MKLTVVCSATGTYGVGGIGYINEDETRLAHISSRLCSDGNDVVGCFSRDDIVGASNGKVRKVRDVSLNGEDLGLGAQRVPPWSNIKQLVEVENLDTMTSSTSVHMHIFMLQGVISYPTASDPMMA